MKAKQFFSTALKSTLIWSLSFNVFAAPTVEEFLKTIELENKARESQLDDYVMSPLSSYLTKEQYKNFKKEISGKDRYSEVMEGKLITFNTKDQLGCAAAKKAMNISEDVCQYDAQNPLVSIVVMRPVENKDYFEKKINFANMSEKEKIGLEALFDFGVMGAGAFGIIYSLPESVSKWDKSKGFSALAAQYGERVKAGPVIDKDDWAVNYIGHPVSGAIYYTMVRHQGYSALESAAFSFCMSTFFWEYGMEAIAEVPSIQDLILTPLIGSILGEVFYSWGNTIENNGGVLLGSKVLGKTATVLMNPAGALANKINKVFKYKFVRDAELSIVNKAPKIDTNLQQYNNRDMNSRSTGYVGLQLKFKF